MSTNSIKLTRRKFLMTTSSAALAVGGAALVGNQFFAANDVRAQSVGGMVNALNIPAELRGRKEAGQMVYDLAMENGETEFFPGIKTASRGVNGSYLGPTLRLRNGDKVRINVTNKIGEDTTLHWHGTHLPASQDGGPHQVVKPNETWSPEFEVKQKAASLWYHPHLMGKTAEHVWNGMAGMMIVDDAESEALDLPKTYGVDDIPVVLQDRIFSRNGRMDYNPSMHSTMMGHVGDTPLVNGTLAPYLDATTRLLRLRVLNGSNASIYNLGLNDDRPFQQIATDGGFLEAPVEQTRIVLSPGERAEIVIELKPGEKISLRNYAIASDNSPGGMMGQGRGMGMGQGMMGRGMMGGMMSSNTGDFEFLEIRPATSLTDGTSVPAKLTTMAWLKEADAVNTRQFDMQMNMGPLVMMGVRNSHLINGKVMKMSRIDEKVKMGDTEIWEIGNSSNIPHPFHMHDVQFQILDRNGQKPAPGEQGRKDTVLVNPGEVARVIMVFEDYADPNAPFMYHCHILEHEDAGMMGQFTVS